MIRHCRRHCRCRQPFVAYSDVEASGTIPPKPDRPTIVCQSKERGTVTLEWDHHPGAYDDGAGTSEPEHQQLTSTLYRSEYTASAERLPDSLVEIPRGPETEFTDTGLRGGGTVRVGTR